MKHYFRFLSIALGAAAILTTATACSDDDDDDYGPTQITANTDVTSYFNSAFAAELEKQGVIPSAAKITGRDVLNVRMIDVSGNPLNASTHLTSLAGIECFRNLKELKAKSNALTELDLSQNDELETVEVQNNQLTKLILPQRDDDMRTLECGKNKLTTLDLSGLDDLTRVDASDNQLTTVDVRGCTDLLTLYLNNNRLTTVDISNSRNLAAFSCEGNPGAAGTLAVKVGVDPTKLPANFTSGSWTYDGQQVSVVYSR